MQARARQAEAPSILQRAGGRSMDESGTYAGASRRVAGMAALPPRRGVIATPGGAGL
jgi:hypothetical protein